jgi:sulfur-carrier protein adenylyltransferase/sulfurtransferase
MIMNSEAKIRYNRHLILDGVGLAGQERLMAARVLVIGAGGLGCPILSYLTAAGVGRIGIVDFDEVDKSNLQRQVLFRTEDIGKNKASAASKHLQALNPLVTFDAIEERLSNQNALDLFEQYDIIIDGTDNFSTRYLINDAAVITGRPLVYGSIYKFQGQVSVFNYKQGPSYRCLFPEPPKPGQIKNCSEIGVIGVLPGIIGTQQANEAIKLILGIGEPLSGKLLIYDALNASSTVLKVDRNEATIKKVIDQKADFLTFDYDRFCGMNTKIESDQIDPQDFSDLLNDGDHLIVDVRELWEVPELIGDNVLQLPIDELKAKIETLQTVKKIVLVCQSGVRSKQIKEYLETTYKMNNLFELAGGINALKDLT